MEWYYYVIVAVFVLCGIFGIYQFLSKIKNKAKLPYGLSKSVLNKSEAAFFLTLTQAVQGKAYIAPKIGLKDYIYVLSGTPERMKHFARMAQKHVDFLLFAPDSYTPLCAIEIDGPSHNSERTKERDAFVKQVYESVGLPLLRFPAKSIYQISEIANALTPILQPSNTENRRQ